MNSLLGAVGLPIRFFSMSSPTLANPCRYIHGPCGVTTVEDIENTMRLVKAFIKHISS